MKYFLKILTASMLIGFGLFSFQARSADLNAITYITESYPPYNYAENGVIKGITVRVLLGLTEELGKPLDRNQIKLWPWARGYRQALTGPMTMLFSMSRTAEREDKFQWVGPILNSKIAIIARKKDGIKVDSPADLKPYKIGAVLDDVGEQLVRASIGGLNIETSATPDLIAKKLNAGRLDVWVYNLDVAKWTIRSVGLNPDDFEAVFILKETQSYYALSKDVPKETIDTLQMGLDKLKAKKDDSGNSVYEQLLN